MVVTARIVAALLVLGAIPLGMAPTATAPCHDTWIGCMVQCTEERATEEACDTLGTVHGWLVRGLALPSDEERHAGVAANVHAGRASDGATGYVRLRFEPQQGAASSVAFAIEFEEGDVEFARTSAEVVNATPEGGEVERRYEFTMRDHHNRIPFTIRATANGTVQEESGVFTVHGEGREPPGGIGDVVRQYPLFLLLLVLLGALVGYLVGRARR